MDDFWTGILRFAETTTTQVGAQLLADFGQVQATEKADGSLVTRADQWADQAIRTAIAAMFPTHGVLTEELAHTFPDQDWCWIVDPLDGTTNFARGIPIWGISLGLLYQGTPVFGYVVLPPLRQTFYGFWPGDSGLNLTPAAYRNHQAIRSHPDHAGEDPRFNTRTHFFNVCTRSTAVLGPGFPCKVRMLGVASYNLLLVAAGVALGGVEATPKIWDIAGVWPIAQAAGAVWVPLPADRLFPLSPGQDYGQRAYPTLLVSHPGLVSVFLPFMQSLGQGDNSSAEATGDNNPA
ncbi:inositol monophosphatase family protein [Trichothermofontia sp.]